MINKTLFIIFEKKDLPNNLQKNVPVFTLNQSILSEKEKNKVQNIFPDPLETSMNAELLSLKVQKVKSEIIKEVKDNKYFSKSSFIDELLDPFLEMKLSSYLYLESNIPNYQKYILRLRKKNYIFTKKSTLILKILVFYSNEINKKGLLDKFYISRFNLFNEILLKIQEQFLNNLFKSIKKNIIFLSDEKVYFIKKLKSNLKNKKNLILYYSPTTSYKKIIQLLLSQFFAFLRRKKESEELGIFLLPNNEIYNNFIKIKKHLKKSQIKEIDNFFAYYLIKRSYLNILYSLSYEKYISKVFKDIKVHKSYFHSLRFSDLFSFARALNKLNNNVFLISHGSHTVQKNRKIDILASKSLGIGMTYTNEKGIKILSQSVYCDRFLDSLKVNYLRINRIMDGKSLNHENKFKNSKITKILYVGTIKQLGSRRYYVESSAEFIGSINLIYNKLIKYSKLFKIIIRIRDVPYEMSNEILNNAFKYKKGLIELGLKNSIYEEIKSCDCLISLSSTTLEEGIEMNKPVMSFGLSRYNHFSNYEKTIKNNHINNNLKIIENSLGRKFIYREKINRKIDYQI